MCTFMFCLIILVIKGKGTTPVNSDAMAAISVGVGLYAIINLAEVVGPCFNPAVAIMQTVY